MILNRGRNGFGTGMIASGDFTNIATNNAADGVYTINGVPCAMTDIIDLDGPDNSFDPDTDLDAGGIKTNGSTKIINIAEPLQAQLLTSGFTVKFDFYFDVSATVGVFAHNLTYSKQADATARNDLVDPESGFRSKRINVSDYNGDGDQDSGQWPIVGQVNRFAVTFGDGFVSASINGGTVLHFDGQVIDGTLLTIGLTVSGETDVRLRSFAFYEPVDDADLPTLSAL